MFLFLMITTHVLVLIVGVLVGLFWGAHLAEEAQRESMRKRSELAEHRVLDLSTDLWGGAGPDMRPGVASAA